MIQKEKGPGLMRKIFILSLLAMMIAWGIGGCGGGGEGTSADPLGTDSLIFGHKNDVAGDDWSMAMEVNPKGTVVLTAKIKNASGTTVAGREVTFGFKANQSGATINASKVNTDAAGEATIIYTAGTVSGFDIVHASISNGAQMDANITVVAPIVIPPNEERQVSLNASPESLAAGQHSIITATVTDGDSKPVSGEVVSFSFVGAALSGATFITLNSGITDASGRALAVYTAGAANPTLDVEDTVQASVAGSTDAIVITRTAAAVVGGGDLLIKVVATPGYDGVIAGAMSVIVATVEKADNTAAVGKSVTFAFVTNNSGATLTVVNGTTDADGKAIAIYTAGGNSSGLSIQDTVSASVTGSTDVQIITRLPAPATGTGNRISSLTLNESVGTLPIVTLPTTSGNCIVTATVTLNDNITPAANETVLFSIVTGRGGFQPDPATTTTVVAATDNSGRANAVFTAPGGSLSGETVVRAQIFGTTNGGDKIGIIRYAPPASI
jgi:hypothetical protein